MNSLLAIPGLGSLGYGFDIFDRYAESSTKKLLFSFPYDPSQLNAFEYGPSGISYNVPPNITAAVVQSGSGNSYVFNTRSDYENFFSIKAKVNGSYGTFSGQFEASFEHATKGSLDYTYSLFVTEYHCWKLKIDDTQINAVADWVRADPDFVQIPDKFDDANSSFFFRFFDKYGTHFVSSVLVGYRLYYSSAVEKSESTSTDTIKANLELEYDAVLTKAGADSQANWSQISKNWVDHRSAQVETTGGNGSLLLAAALPQFGDNFSTQYKDWYTNADKNPAPVDFELSSISLLFADPKRQAVENAIQAYAQQRIYAESKSDGCTILVSGKVMEPSNPTLLAAAGFQVSIIDRKTLIPADNMFFGFPLDEIGRDSWLNMYNSLNVFLREYNDTKYLVIIAAKGMRLDWCPTQSTYNLFLSIGASTGLGGWIDTVDDQGSPYPQPVTYLLVGVPGRGTGTGFEAIGIGDGNLNYYIWNGEWQCIGSKAPNINLSVMLRKFGPAASLALHEPFLQPRSSTSLAN